MFTCRRMRGLIAASLYGDLTDKERRELDGHLASCAACRAEAESLARLVAAIPDSAPELDVDLVPALRRTRPIREPVAYGFGRRLAWAGAVAAAVVGIIAYGLIERVGMPTHKAPTHVTSVIKVSAVRHALDEAAASIQDRDFVGAYRVLREAVEAHPDDPLAGQAQVQCADIAFSELHLYPEAFDAYEAVAMYYPHVFSTSVESITRRDVLAEARKEDYASLYALDVARGSVLEQFAEFEKVVARFPQSFVASLAIEEMAQLVGDAATGTGHRVLAMERARDKCTDPIAIARLNIEIGQVYWKELGDPDRARDQFTEVLESENGALVQLARESLASLESNAWR